MYLCNCSFKTEEELLEHYEKEHADLVQLGLTLRKSKKKRTEEKLEKAKVKAQKKIDEELGSKKDQKKKNGSVDISQNQYSAIDKFCVQKENTMDNSSSSSSTSDDEY